MTKPNTQSNVYYKPKKLYKIINSISEIAIYMLTSRAVEDNIFEIINPTLSLLLCKYYLEGFGWVVPLPSCPAPAYTSRVLTLNLSSLNGYSSPFLDGVRGESILKLLCKVCTFNRSVFSCNRVARIFLNDSTKLSSSSGNMFLNNSLLSV